VTRWPTATIGSACTVFSGGTPSKGNAAYWRGTIPWVSAKDLKADRIFDAELHISQQACDESAAKMAPVGSLLMLVRGMGLANGIQVGQVTAPVAFNQDLRAIVPPPGVDSRFLLLALRHRLADGGKGVLSSAAHGTLKIDADALRQVEFPVPPPHEQRRIVAILDEAFAGIATAKANAEKNLLNTREWSARQLATALGAASAGGRSDALEKLVAPSCTLSYGIVQPGDEVSGGLPVVRPVDLGDKTVYADGLKRIDPALARSYARTTLEGNDLLLCVRGTTGTVAIADPTLAGANVTRGIVPIRFDPNTISQALGYYLLRSEPVQAQIRAKTYGTALMQINIGDLRKIVIAFPPLEEQAALVEKLDAIQEAADQLADIYARKLAALDELKRSLLHQAFSGGLS
jgi:type I restriction enzyme S subunit